MSRKTNSLQLQKAGQTAPAKQRILEVSDNEALRQMIATICETRGFDVVQARCGDDALNRYRTCGPFSLVLTDLFWYDEGAIEPPLSDTETIRHGAQLALALRKLAPEQKIVIHTAAGQPNELMSKELAGIRILRKPFGREELESLL